MILKTTQFHRGHPLLSYWRRLCNVNFLGGDLVPGHQFLATIDDLPLISRCKSRGVARFLACTIKTALMQNLFVTTLKLYNLSFKFPHFVHV